MEVKVHVPEVIISNINRTDMDRLIEYFEKYNPNFKMGIGVIRTKEGVEFKTEYGGVRYIWIMEGSGEAYIPEGYRTQEGDGEKLPNFYEPEELDRDIMRALEVLEKNLNLISEEVPYGDTIRNCVKSILDRYDNGIFRGDITGEIAQLTPIERGGWCHTTWSEDKQVNEAIELLIERFDQIGWSTKVEGSYEPLKVGDQVVLRSNEKLLVRGNMKYIWIEDLKGIPPRTSTLRRVRYLKDLTGGCNIAFDPFRRLALTWNIKGISKENPDGYNRVNNHIVNMAEEFSRTHFHPSEAIGGGKAQHELYLVLDPSEFGLRTYGRKSYAYFFPDLDDLSKYVKLDLRPGDVVYIPPGTGHRAINVLAAVITLPGFKPRNEWYIDKKIKRLYGGKIPYNEFLISVTSRYDVL
ncbi:MAG: hypothetical protein DRJ49_03250 [Thermoprotei archaeon]|nr:MAG: hypothetical protein DRJ49_03250 [Thermoprotei archaeon]